ncbi:MAG: hypothetical protein IID32_08945, partial [Planctomycetes bacterium]|nr:hypothetical protein [Planctomycetota bacterium]
GTESQPILVQKVLGAGIQVGQLVSIERLEINGAGGDDNIHVFATLPGMRLIIRGGSGNDTIHLAGDEVKIDIDPPAYTVQPESYIIDPPPRVIGQETIHVTPDPITFTLPFGYLYGPYSWVFGGFFWFNGSIARSYLQPLMQKIGVITDVDINFTRTIVTLQPRSYSYLQPIIEDQDPFTFTPPAYRVDPPPFTFTQPASYVVNGINSPISIEGGIGDDTIIVNTQDNASEPGVLNDYPAPPASYLSRLGLSFDATDAEVQSALALEENKDIMLSAALNYYLNNPANITPDLGIQNGEGASRREIRTALRADLDLARAKALLDHTERKDKILYKLSGLGISAPINEQGQLPDNVGVTYQNTETIIVYLGEFDDTFTIENTAPGTRAMVYGGPGDDTITINGIDGIAEVYGDFPDNFSQDFRRFLSELGNLLGSNNNFDPESLTQVKNLASLLNTDLNAGIDLNAIVEVLNFNISDVRFEIWKYMQDELNPLADENPDNGNRPGFETELVFLGNLLDLGHDYQQANLNDMKALGQLLNDTFALNIKLTAESGQSQSDFISQLDADLFKFDSVVWNLLTEEFNLPDGGNYDDDLPAHILNGINGLNALNSLLALPGGNTVALDNQNRDSVVALLDVLNQAPYSVGVSTSDIRKIPSLDLTEYDLDIFRLLTEVNTLVDKPYGQDTFIVNAHFNGNLNDTLTLDGQGRTDTYAINLKGSQSILINVFDTGAIDDGADALTINGTDQNDTFLVRRNFVANLLNNGSIVERVNYDKNINARLRVNGHLGDDLFAVDDNSSIMTLDGGVGNDTFQIGQLFGTDRDANAGVAPGDEIQTIETTSGGFLSNGISYPTTIYGDEGEDVFSVYHNLAVLRLEGGDGNDEFVIRAFALANPEDNQQEKTILNGGKGDDLIQYAINAPVDIDGGQGYDTVVVTGTELDDNFVITDKGIFGAGLQILFNNIESFEVD